MSGSVVVLKFGGTSLGTAARVRRAARRIRAHLQRGHLPVVVVSANGRTTDRILRRVRQVLPAGGASEAREVDRALATGEDFSAALLTIALSGLGIRARSLRGGEAGLQTTGGHGGGQIRQVDTTLLRALLERSIIPVVSGFQGQRVDGETVTLGRGGSDVSAVAIAAALDSSLCHIITDVAAVHDRDPNTHPDACPLPALSHRELLDIVDAGAQVVHPDAASLALTHSVPLRVYHHRAPFSRPGGTRIDPTPAGAPELEGVA